VSSSQSSGGSPHKKNSTWSSVSPGIGRKASSPATSATGAQDIRNTIITQRPKSSVISVMQVMRGVTPRISMDVLSWKACCTIEAMREQH
jgi:hypothetical protein